MLQRLTKQELTRVHEAAAAADERTHAHFSLVIVPVSNRYLLFPVLWAAAISMFTACLIALGWPHLGLRTGMMIEVLIFAVLALSFDWLPLRLLLVPRRVKREHAHELARHEFAARILSARKRTSGMVFFVSLGERYVEVLADHELHARVGTQAWNDIVADFTVAAASGQIADGFVKSIDSCASLLESHYPTASA